MVYLEHRQYGVVLHVAETVAARKDPEVWQRSSHDAWLADQGDVAIRNPFRSPEIHVLIEYWKHKINGRVNRAPVGFYYFQEEGANWERVDEMDYRRYQISRGRTPCPDDGSVTLNSPPNPRNAPMPTGDSVADAEAMAQAEQRAKTVIGREWASSERTWQENDAYCAEAAGSRESDEFAEWEAEAQGGAYSAEPAGSQDDDDEFAEWAADDEFAEWERG